MANLRSSVRSRAGSRPDSSEYERVIYSNDGRFGAKSKRRYGHAEPRVHSKPLRELTPETSAGFACIEFAEAILGIELLPWQKWLLIHALEMLDDGTFRFRTVVVLVARQNGKSTLAQVLALFFMYVRGVALIIGTAQNLDIAEEVWQGAVDIAEDVDELSEEIERVVRVNGKKSLELVSGPRYKVQAASRRGGRGLSGDLVVMDELREHQTWDAWGAVTKTTLARQHAQVWGLSNAGDVSSVVLRHLRKSAHAHCGDPDGLNREAVDSTAELTAEDEAVLAAAEEILEEAAESLGIFEWSAPAECDMYDREMWALANPSMGYTLTERAVASALSTDPEWVFRTECLCQWSEGTLTGPFPPGAWDTALDAESEVPESADVVFGMDVSADRSRAHIGVAGKRADGDWHVEVVASRVGVDWAVRWFAERASLDNPMKVAIQGRGAPISGFKDDLNAVEGLTVVELAGPDLGVASGKFWDAVSAHVGEGGEGAVRVWHRGQPLLDRAAPVAATRPAGDGAWLWDRVRSPVDISPLVSVSNAFGVASRVVEPEPVSAYEARRGVLTV